MTENAGISDLAEVPTRGARRDPVEILLDQGRSRDPRLVPVRHARMAATPFTFFRGAAAVMAADLGATAHSGVHTQLCGDAHLSNLGLFYTPERRMTFDLNDFDETHPGPFEWDVKRLAASFAVAARQNGLDEAAVFEIAKVSARSYQKSIRAAARAGTLDAWYAHVDVESMSAAVRARMDTSLEEHTQRALKKARHRNSAQALSKLCIIDATGRARIRSEPPLLVPIREIVDGGVPGRAEELIAARLASYRGMLSSHVRALFDQFHVVDVAHKVVGVGSVGTRAWVALFIGTGVGDPLFLQLKEAQESVLAPYVDVAPYEDQGRRVVEGQRLMQAASDVFLGWTSGEDETGENRDLYVRQLRDGKGAAVIEAMDEAALTSYAWLCGRVLANAHGRTASRHGIAAYLDGRGKFPKTIAAFAVDYADINETDHAAFTAAIADGTVPSRDLI